MSHNGSSRPALALMDEIDRKLLVLLQENCTLSIAEIPMHAHIARGSANNGTSQTAANNVLGVIPGRAYTDASALTSLTPGTITNVGGSQAHLNMQPFLTLNFSIALQGIFPSPT